MKPSLVVLAAGMGSRYGGLKQVDPVGPSGESIIDYSIFDAIRAGFGKIVFIIRKEIELVFRESIGAEFEKFIPVKYVYQKLNALPDGFSLPKDRVKPWGTAHAILMAKEVVDCPFAVINSDDFYGQSAFQLISSYLSKAKDTESYADFSMVGFILKNTLSDFGSVSRGVSHCSSDGNLVDIIERTGIKKDDDKIFYVEEGSKHPLTGEEIVSMNMLGFTPSIFKYIEEMFLNFLKTKGNELKSEFYIPYVVDELIKNGKAKVKVLKSYDKWFGVTYKEDKPFVMDRIKELVEEGIYSEKLF
jgi:NDP-sugar pyrophosphorylase family protein